MFPHRHPTFIRQHDRLSSFPLPSPLATSLFPFLCRFIRRTERPHCRHLADGAEIFRTSTAEPSESGYFWRVRKGITRYSYLLYKPRINATMMLENVVNDVYTGVYHAHVSFLFYKENITTNDIKLPSIISLNENDNQNSATADMVLFKTPPDVIIPVCRDGRKEYWFKVESESDVHGKRVRFPKHIHQVILELYASFHGNDEFWYTNPPNSHIRMNNLTAERGNGAYREVLVTIDGKFVGSEVIFLGGINPLFWEPVVGIGGFNLPSFDLDLTPFWDGYWMGDITTFELGSTTPYRTGS